MEPGPFRSATIDAAASKDWADALHDIHVGALDLLIVRDALPPAACTAAVTRLEHPDTPIRWTPQEHPDPKRTQFRLIGESLSPYVGHPDGPDLDHYFAEGDYVRERVRALFDVDFEAEIEARFTALGGGRRVLCPSGPREGQRYAPATVRALPASCEIPVHVGNYFITTPATRHLATLVDLRDQLSYFVTLQPPEGGGALVVYDFQWGQDPPPMTREMRANWDDRPEPWPHRSFSPGVGELLLFNGGRFYHRVSRVTGPRVRWTIGGFLSFSPDDHTIVYWS